MIYEIAGLKLRMEPEFPRLRRQSDGYRSAGEPVMEVFPEPSDRLHTALDNCTQEDREYICASAAFCRGILRYGRFFLHASAVVSDGEAYLFSAPSGTGKTTHTANWLRRFDGCYILNDDKPVIYPEPERVTAYGTPFAGKTDLQVNRGVPLKAICFLKQGSENRIARVTDDRAIALFLNNTYRPKSAEDMNRLLDMIGQVADRVSIFEMSCTHAPEAAEISYKAMKGL